MLGFLLFPIVLGAIRHGGETLPQVNVAVLVVVLLTLIPVAISVRLARDTGGLRRS